MRNTFLFTRDTVDSFPWCQRLLECKWFHWIFTLSRTGTISQATAWLPLSFKEYFDLDNTQQSGATALLSHNSALTYMA